MPTVLITGASGGIGEAMCDEFRKAGYRVVGLDLAKQSKADVHLVCDLNRLATDASYRSEQARAIRSALGGTKLDVLVNNAAAQILGSVAEVSAEDWQRTMNVNLTAPFLLAQMLLPELEAASGSVVNVASIHATLTKPRFVAYATSKAALVGLTRAMAVDLGGRVRVNAICPAAVDTPMLREGFRGNEAALAELAAAHPSGRIAAPSEVARVALMLAAKDVGFVNGAAVDVGGGIHGRLNDPV